MSSSVGRAWALEGMAMDGPSSYLLTYSAVRYGARGCMTATGVPPLVHAVGGRSHTTVRVGGFAHQYRP